MKHPNSGNWKNQRKNPLAGIHTGPPEANRNQVRALLSGTKEEALGTVRHHAGNRSFLNLAEEIEEARHPRRRAVLDLIREQLANLPLAQP